MTAARAELAVTVAIEAGRILMSHFGRVATWDHKGPADLVSVADRESEAYLRRAILDAFPDDGFLGEESGGVSVGSPGWVWCVDPLDGTTNFLHRIPMFAVSIGLLKDGKLVFGVVHAPALGETWRAAAGEGAFRNDQPIAVSTTSLLSEALLATGFPVSRRGEALDGVLATIRRALSACQDLHRHGCASLDLCAVAAGRLDGYWEPGLHPWDLAAGVQLVASAGGWVTDLDGSPFDLSSGQVLATNGRIHRDLARLLAGG